MEGGLKDVGRGEVELSSDSDDPDLSMDIFVGGHDDESTFGIEGIFEKVRSGRFSKKVADRNDNTDEKGDIEAEDET